MLNGRWGPTSEVMIFGNYSANRVESVALSYSCGGYTSTLSVFTVMISQDQTHIAPSMKMPVTAIFCLVGICSFHTMGHGMDKTKISSTTELTA